MFWSSMRWRVITETACGISRNDWSPLAIVTTFEAYEPVPSVVAMPRPGTVTGARVATSALVAARSRYWPWASLTASTPVPDNAAMSAACES
ncbi:Uncharacterised protein [Achromobacter xylosoxidans]|nr:Uncharacterised protein [Achromobacter xylosoxidans]CUI53617.1 Uncharacterised protein [Achromobacter xylosoxidans]CUI61715.1 Uncharacterised protein [Achromobacter xylosoxidans]CUI74473.1 Uncharacterised protein [Achromobacter xylosoxidans]CUI78376.1 Uncharacterised protein [Achromobacter xylosoxidans]